MNIEASLWVVISVAIGIVFIVFRVQLADKQTREFEAAKNGRLSFFYTHTPSKRLLTRINLYLGISFLLLGLISLLQAFSIL